MYFVGLIVLLDVYNIYCINMLCCVTFVILLYKIFEYSYIILCSPYKNDVIIFYIHTICVNIVIKNSFRFFLIIHSYFTYYIYIFFFIYKQTTLNKSARFRLLKKKKKDKTKCFFKVNKFFFLIL